MPTGLDHPTSLLLHQIKVLLQISWNPAFPVLCRKKNMQTIAETCKLLYINALPCSTSICNPSFFLSDSSLLIITGMGLIFWRLGRDQKVRFHNDYPPWKIHVQHLKQWGWKMSRPPGRCCDSFWGVRSATVWFLFPNLPFPSICCCWHLRSKKASLFAEVPFWQSRTVPCRHLPLLRKHIANGWICNKEHKNEQAQ